MGYALLIIVVILVVLVITIIARSLRIVPQARTGIVERFGKYKGTLSPGLNVLVPFIDRVRYIIDMREQVVSFPPQGMITQDNLTVSIDTVLYFQVTDPIAATYEIANYITAVEQLTMTTLRNIVGGMDLERTLTSRESINSQLSAVLDGDTGRWGLKVKRVEIKSIEPPPSIKDAMEKQMRADRDKRAVILTAEGERQSAILSAEGNKRSAILNAEGAREARILAAQADREASILRAQGEGQAIQTVFQSIHDGQPDQALLAYQYLQLLPQIAQGDANKLWILPSEFTKTLEGLGTTLSTALGIPAQAAGDFKRVDMGPGAGEIRPAVSEADEAVKAAIAEAEQSTISTDIPQAFAGGSGTVDPTTDAPASDTPATDSGSESGGEADGGSSEGDADPGTTPGA
jgi:regulator of protease activity HflC (stomatin/prohibitin superfamily)